LVQESSGWRQEPRGRPAWKVPQSFQRLPVPPVHLFGSGYVLLALFHDDLVVRLSR